MIYHYKCTLLSPVVLSARAATEGQIDCLDFIPGAKFMGIVAKGYDDLSDDARRDLFHSNTVKFSNAYPVVGDRKFYPAPLVYFSEKGNKVTDSPIYLDHSLPKEKRGELSKAGTQLKQLRSGFVDAAGERYLKVDTDFALKSAYDAELRRSKDSQMYGYFSLPAGMEFAFSVEDEDGKYEQQIEDGLLGEHGIGRSRTAEYGRVRIERTDGVTAPAAVNLASGPVTVYALSDLGFYDEFGQAKRPEAKDLGFADEAKIDWARTQVQSGDYHSWNSQRWNRNADRWVIKKGSVFVVNGARAEAADGIFWVGSYHQEGFGQVWVNPTFLEATEDEYLRPKMSKVALQASVTDAPEVPGVNQGLLALLKRRTEGANKDHTIYQEVNTFIELHRAKFYRISSSQWGTLRNYAKHAADEKALTQLVFSEQTGFLHRGQSEKTWRTLRGDLRDKVMDDNTVSPLLFLQKLAAEMAKRTKNQTA